MRIWLVLAAASLLLGTTARAAEHSAPDGQVIDRVFEVAVTRSPKIVLCTDDDAYAARLQSFIDYVLADLPIEIVAWERAPNAEELIGSHLVYAGHPPEEVGALECLGKYPVLSAFVELTRDYAPRTLAPPVPTPGLEGLAIVSQGFGAPLNLMSSQNELSVYFCYPVEATCSFDIAVALFGINGAALCSNQVACDRLKAAMSNPD